MLDLIKWSLEKLIYEDKSRLVDAWHSKLFLMMFRRNVKSLESD